MTNLLKPDKIIDSYDSLDLDELRSLKITHIFMDIDNTLAPYYDKVASSDCITYIDFLKKEGFTVVLVSNNKKERVETFAKSLGLDYRYFSLKPLPFTYLELLKDYHIGKENVLCVGDQVLTDVIGARLAGLRVYYSKPLVEKDSFSTKINRKLERIIMRHYKW